MKRARGGFTLAEVLVALGLVAVVGGAAISLLIRTEVGGRTAESAEAATYLVRAMVGAMKDSAPPWLPQVGASVDLTEDQIRTLLQGGGISYTDPRLYQARVSRERDGASGLDRYRIEVCVTPGGQRTCFTQTFLYNPVDRAYLTPPSGEGEVYAPPPGQAHVQLVVDGDSPGAADVRVSVGGSTTSYTRYGVYSQSIPPGGVSVAAYEARDGRYSYTPSPQNQSANLPAGLSRTFTVTYSCATGAAEIAVIPPPGGPLPQGTVTLAGQDVSAGGLLPYLAPGTYSLQARSVTRGGYTYDPTYSPSQNLRVQPCNDATATVAYTPVTGRLQVDIATPSGVTPSVRVEGPDPRMPRTLSTPTTLEDLTPGSYTLTPQDVLKDGVRYRGSANPPRPSVRAGETAQARVVYSPVSARLRLTVEGPQGAPNPQLRITGPRGYVRTITAYGTVNLDDLVPGDYRVQASVVSSNLYTYTPSPAEATLSLGAGDRTEHRVVYRATTGALTVSVQGLPQGVGPDVVKVDGTPLRANPETLPYLSPGDHTVEAATFTHGGYVYAPDAERRSVTVQPGQIATASVVYTRLTGTVTVQVQGLPDPSEATWSLTTPTGVRTGQGNATLTGMPTGDYRLTASSVTHGGIRYDPTVTPESGTLLPGRSLTFTATYTPVTGNLNLTVEGLASGARVVVERQGGGYSTTLDRTALLTGLPPGQYLITAHPVSRQDPTPYGALTYTYAPGSPAQRTVQVDPGATAEARVVYTRQEGNLTLRVTGLPSGSSATVELAGGGGFSRREAVPGGSTATRTFSNLPTGEYRALGPDVLAGGFTYKAREARGTLAHASTLTLSLDYAPADGRLVVTTTGLPPGAPKPTITVRGDSANVVYAVNDYSLTLERLLPGRYTVSVTQVGYDGYMWKADPSQLDVQVQAGQTATARFAYVEQAAYIRIAATGIPSGASASGRVTGGALSRTYTLSASSSTTTIKVPLGNYRVTADPFDHGGYRYNPSPTEVGVGATTPGSVYPVSFAYQEASASIALTISGLPNTAATLSLSGPISRSQACGNGTCTFTRLPLGTYTLTASPVQSGSYTYRATLNPSSYALTAPGQNLTGSVAYAPVDGLLQVAVSGPSGMPTPTVDLYLGSTLVASFSGVGTHTRPYTPPGTYRLVPRQISTQDGYYSAPEATVTVSAGQTATASVVYTYTPTRGTLALKVSGLPSGVQARITLRNASGSYNQSLTLGNGTYTYSLTPDTYSVIPSRVASTYNYVAPSTSATVVAGGTANANVAYAVENGTLTLTLSGLPSGGTAAVTLRRQEGGYTSTQYLGNGRHTLSLPTGTYTLTASQVASGAEVYVPNPTTATVNLTATGASASFSYSRGTGSLRIALSGVPSGRSANVRITGPGGYSATLSMGNETREVAGLNPGGYRIEPGGIWISSFLAWKTIACPNPRSADASVAVGGTASLSFTYSTLTYWWWEDPCPIF